MSAGQPWLPGQWEGPAISNGDSQSDDAAPDSLLSHLRGIAAAKAQVAELTLGVPGVWEGQLRIVYGYVSLDQLEQYQQVNAVSQVSASLDLLAHAVRRIEGRDPTNGEWMTLRDRMGPLIMDDRLTRYLQLPRPSEDFEYATREVYEIMWQGNGFGVGQHAQEIARWMGLTEESLVGESPRGSMTTSAPQQSSA